MMVVVVVAMLVRVVLYCKEQQSTLRQPDDPFIKRFAAECSQVQVCRRSILCVCVCVSDAVCGNNCVGGRGDGYKGQVQICVLTRIPLLHTSLHTADYRHRHCCLQLAIHCPFLTCSDLLCRQPFLLFLTCLHTADNRNRFFRLQFVIHQPHILFSHFCTLQKTDIFAFSHFFAHCRRLWASLP